MAVPFNDLRRGVVQAQPALEAAALRVLDSGWFVLGAEVTRSSRMFAAYCGAAERVGVANGTDAIELALRALGVAAGDRSCASPTRGSTHRPRCWRSGREPQFVDIDPTRCCSTSLRRGGAGHPPEGADRDSPLRPAGAGRGAVAARGGARHPDGRGLRPGPRRPAAGRAGRGLGPIGCFSFYPTKNLGALGDGGAWSPPTRRWRSGCARCASTGGPASIGSKPPAVATAGSTSCRPPCSA